jgi:hypothetical protein
MEVSTVKDHVTHAVIGGMEAESMGISDDPAFYHMLSSQLYSDEKRAVIRETLCNAWDAHIEAGCTDKFVDVTLTDNKLTIQDYGLGIPRNLIRPIYGVYGSSTKKKNALVTGGFGLGCKAPFSYVDHFEVISCHDGEKTIYRMSKSSGEVMGKPSILPIMSVPTSESGITVSLHVKSLSDKSTFNRLINEIASQGEMKVRLNGIEIKTMPFSKAKHGYLIVKKSDFGGRSNHPIQVRYGSVIYPVEDNPAYAREYRSAKAYLQDITANNGNLWHRNHSVESDWILILQAQPNTISITPSRESLSMVEQTTDTLNKLLTNFVETVFSGEELKQVCYKLASQSINDIWRFGKPADALSMQAGLIRTETVEQHKPRFITDPVDAASYHLMYNFPTWKGFHEKQIRERINALIASGFGNRGLLQTYRTAYFKRKHLTRRVRGYQGLNDNKRYVDYSTHPWFATRILAPVVEAIRKEPLLDLKNFGVWDNTRYHRGPRGYREADFIPYKDYRIPGIDELLPYARGVVIIGHSRLAIEERAHRMSAMKHWFGDVRKNLCYIVPRNPRKLEAAIKLFSKLGFYVVDTTQRQSWDPAPEVIAAQKAMNPPLPKKKKLSGYLCLAGLGDSLNLNKLFDEEAARIDKPEFVVRISPATQVLKNFGDAHYFADCQSMQAIVRMYGERGGVVSMDKALKNAYDEGSLSLNQFIARELLNAYKNNPEIESHYRNSCDHMSGDHDYWLNTDKHDLLQSIIEDDVLRTKFGLALKHGQDARDFILLYKSFDSNHDRTKYPEIKEIHDLIESWVPHEPFKKLLKSIKESQLVRFLDTKQLRTNLGLLAEDRKKVARSLIMTALKG